MPRRSRHWPAGGSGSRGGSIYDALVGAAASEHRITPATRDHRALHTYRALEVEVELLL